MVVHQFTSADCASAETEVFCIQLWIQTVIFCVLFCFFSVCPAWRLLHHLTGFGWGWKSSALPGRVHRNGDTYRSYLSRSQVHWPYKIPSIWVCQPADKLCKNGSKMYKHSFSSHLLLRQQLFFPIFSEMFFELAAIASLTKLQKCIIIHSWKPIVQKENYTFLGRNLAYLTLRYKREEQAVKTWPLMDSHVLPVTQVERQKALAGVGKNTCVVSFITDIIELYLKSIRWLYV